MPSRVPKMEGTDVKSEILEMGLSFIEVLEYRKTDIVNAVDPKEASKIYLKTAFETMMTYMSSKIGINFRYKSTLGSETCLICQKEFEYGDLCRKQTCEHLFHAFCICNLINNQVDQKCPICLSEIPSIF